MYQFYLIPFVCCCCCCCCCCCLFIYLFFIFLRIFVCYYYGLSLAEVDYFILMLILELQNRCLWKYLLEKLWSDVKLFYMHVVQSWGRFIMMRNAPGYSEFLWSFYIEGYPDIGKTRKLEAGATSHWVASDARALQIPQAQGIFPPPSPLLFLFFCLSNEHYTCFKSAFFFLRNIFFWYSSFL